MPTTKRKRLLRREINLSSKLERLVNWIKESHPDYVGDMSIHRVETDKARSNQVTRDEQRIRKLLADWGKTYDEYFDALRKEPETDYCRSKMDERIKDICKSGDWIPFEDRYRFLPEMKY